MIQLQTKLNQVAATKSLLRGLSSESKNQVLQDLASLLERNKPAILQSNALDLEAYKKSSNFHNAFLDRLTLNEKRIEQMQESLLAVANMADPVGQIISTRTLKNALVLQQVRSPLGLIFLIFEARPNVITEAFSLAFKAGNAFILKGGKESDRTSEIIYSLIEQALKQNQLPADIFWGLVGRPREETDYLMKQNKFIDVLIPRGGEHLIKYVSENSNIPIIKNDRGMCHIYVHEKADLTMALNIIDNAKTQRPSVCNATETVLVDESIAHEFLPLMWEKLSAKGVDFFVCENAMNISQENSSAQVETHTYAALENSFDTEYLDLKLNVCVVPHIDAAIAHIEKHGSKHSEAIITADAKAAAHFQTAVDAAAVYWNASTRFTDGGEFGLGAEIGISTQKLHVRGPVGLDALTSLRWLIQGNGQIR